MEAFISELTEGGFMRVIQYKEFCTQALDIWDYVAEGMPPQKINRDEILPRRGEHPKVPSNEVLYISHIIWYTRVQLHDCQEL